AASIRLNTAPLRIPAPRESARPPRPTAATHTGNTSTAVPRGSDVRSDPNDCRAPAAKESLRSRRRNIKRQGAGSPGRAAVPPINDVTGSTSASPQRCRRLGVKPTGDRADPRQAHSPARYLVQPDNGLTRKGDVARRVKQVGGLLRMLGEGRR